VAEAIADFERAAQLFWLRGSKTNAQKTLKNLAKLQQQIESSEPRSETRPDSRPDMLSAARSAMPEAV